MHSEGFYVGLLSEIDDGPDPLRTEGVIESHVSGPGATVLRVLVDGEDPFAADGEKVELRVLDPAI
jgi:hypothetical protein